MKNGKSFPLALSHSYFTGIFAYFMPIEFMDVDTIEWRGSKLDLWLEAGEVEFQADPWMVAKRTNSPCTSWNSYKGQDTNNDNPKF